jgi:hypothetical protein
MVRECLLAVDAAGSVSRELLPASIIEFPPFSYRHLGGSIARFPTACNFPASLSGMKNDGSIFANSFARRRFCAEKEQFRPGPGNTVFIDTEANLHRTRGINAYCALDVELVETSP